MGGHNKEGNLNDEIEDKENKNVGGVSLRNILHFKVF